MDIQRVPSRDGTDITFERTGDGPPLVLVHGTAGDRNDWRPVIPLLAESYTVCAIDRRGRGESGDADDYALEREFEDVAAVVDSLERPAFLAGHSFGGVCALEGALRADNVEKLVLNEPVIPPDVSGFFPAETIDRIERLVDGGDLDEAMTVFALEIARLPQNEVDAIRAEPEVWEGALQTVDTAPREVRGMNAYKFRAEQFTRFDTPTQLIVGTESPDFMKQAVEIVAGALSHIRIDTLEGVGHLGMMIDPEQFVDAVVDFLGEAP